jgi:plastin-1
MQHCALVGALVSISLQSAFSSFISRVLGADTFLRAHHYVPLDSSAAEFSARLSDGIIFCKLLNAASTDAVDERALNFPRPDCPLSRQDRLENMTLAVNSAASIGCGVAGLRPVDLLKGSDERREQVTLTLLWQIIKSQVVGTIAIQGYPELVGCARVILDSSSIVVQLTSFHPNQRNYAVSYSLQFCLASNGETPQTLHLLRPEDLLLRWVNYHLAKVGAQRRITAFASELADRWTSSICITKVQTSLSKSPTFKTNLSTLSLAPTLRTVSLIAVRSTSTCCAASGLQALPMIPCRRLISQGGQSQYAVLHARWACRLS